MLNTLSAILKNISPPRLSHGKKKTLPLLVPTLLVTMLSSCVPSRTPTMSAEQIFDATSPSVAKVFGLSGQVAGNRSGTGFAVSLGGETVLVTNKHVVESSSVVLVETSEGIWSSPSWRTHPSLDLALIDLPLGLDIRPLVQGESSSLRPGRRVYTVGYPLGAGLAAHEGLLSTSSGYDLVFSAPISTGASGSPLLDSSGRVLGVCRAFMPDAQNYNLAIPIALLHLPAQWENFHPVPDESLQLYLSSVMRSKEVTSATVREWFSLAREYPEWEPWVHRTMLTRRPLLAALESVTLSVHSVDWASVATSPSPAESVMVELMAKSANELQDAWDMHLLNLSASRKEQPASVSWESMADMTLVPKLIESVRGLVAATSNTPQSSVFAIDPLPSNDHDRTFALALLLENHGELERRWRPASLP